MTTKLHKRLISRLKNHKKAIFFALLPLFSLVRAGSQTESIGTVVIIGREENKIVVATDSKAVSHSGKNRNDDCKILALNNNFFVASAGIRHFDESSRMTGLQLSWDTHEIASKVFASLKSKSVKEITENWGNTGTRLLNKFPLRERETLASGTGLAKEGSVLLVAGLDKNGRIDAKVTTITFDSGTFVSQVKQIPIRQIAGIGHGKELVNEFISGKTMRARKETSNWRLTTSGKTPDEIYRSWITQLARLVIFYDDSGEVGGQVEAVELRSNGTLSWVEYGPCKNQQAPKAQPTTP